MQNFWTQKSPLFGTFAKTPKRNYFRGLDLVHPDGGGMLRLFRRSIFEMLEKFDERHNLCFEDVDICARLKSLSFQAVLFLINSIVHHAQGRSHNNGKYSRWYIVSMMRLFTTPVYRQLLRLRWL